MPTLYDHRGRTVTTASLEREYGAATTAGVRTIHQHPVATGLTPARLGRVLRSAAEGDADEYLTLAEEMEERELHYSSVIRTRRLAVAGLEAVVEAATDDKHDEMLADEVRRLVSSPAFSDLVDDLLDALGKGYSAVEIGWERTSKRWTPARYDWRDPRWFRFDRETGQELRLLDAADPVEGIPLQPFKWIVHRPRLKAGLPIRGGLAYLAAVAFCCKSFSVRDWMAFAETFGMPLRLGRYGPQATDEEIATLVRAVANLGTDAAAVVPKGMDIEFIKADGGAGGPELFLRLAGWWDSQVSKAVLGQTMTTDDGSSLSQAKVHNEVRLDLLKADARQLAATIARDLVKPFIDLNWGPQEEYPTIRFQVDEPLDLKALSEALAPLIDRGLRVEESVIRDWFGLATPGKDAAVLVPQTVAARGDSSPALNRATNRSAVKPDPYEELDDIRDEALNEWQPVITPMVDPIRKAISESSSLEDLLQRLDGIELDTSELVRRLAEAMFKARALGDAQE